MDFSLAEKQERGSCVNHIVQSVWLVQLQQPVVPLLLSIKVLKSVDGQPSVILFYFIFSLPLLSILTRGLTWCRRPTRWATFTFFAKITLSFSLFQQQQNHARTALISIANISEICGAKDELILLKPWSTCLCTGSLQDTGFNPYSGRSPLTTALIWPVLNSQCFTS